MSSRTINCTFVFGNVLSDANYAIIFGVKKKNYKLVGTVIAAIGAIGVIVGVAGFRSVSADPMVAEQTDWSFLLMAGGGILIIAGIILSLWLFASD